MSNGAWIVILDKCKKITDLTSKDLTEGNLDNNTYPKAPKFFVKYSLNTISYAVKSNNTSKYKVGCTKIIYQTWYC